MPCICKCFTNVEGVGVLHGASNLVGTMNGMNMTSIWMLVLGLLASLLKAERIPDDQFGKSVFYQRALDDDLTSECASNTFCLDRAVSRGSCYHSDSDDTHIGNAVLCDVSEVECCGYEGCGDPDNRGNHPNGDAHNYYWYATGYRAGFSPFAGAAGGCCHCAAGCDFAEQEAAREERNVTGSCIYRDVTSTACQRATDQARPEDGEDRRIGHLRCPIPGTFSLSDATIREAVPPPPSPSPSPGGGGSGGNDPLNTPENAGLASKFDAWLMAALASLCCLAQVSVLNHN